MNAASTQQTVGHVRCGSNRQPPRRPRPAVLHGATQHVVTPFGAVFVTVNKGLDGHPFEVFVRLDKAGSRAMADAEAIARLISLALRWEIPASEIHRQLRGISCEAAAGAACGRVLSVPDAIAQAMAILIDGVSACHLGPEEEG